MKDTLCVQNEKNPDILKTRYGLPVEVQFCKRCVISNQRPCSEIEFLHTRETKKRTITFHADGICEACILAEKKRREIDWKERERMLRDLCDRYRKNDGYYDCLVPGSGGKDSFYAAYKLKYEYGMNPLTVTWAPNIYTDWGWRNHQAWIHAGFTNYLCTPNGRTHRLLTRLAVENLLHPFQPFIIGQKNLAPKLALLYNIPLIFFGENEAEYGNPMGDNANAKRDYRYFTSTDQSQVYLGGTSLQDLHHCCGVRLADLEPYLPVNPELVEKHKIEVHYLGYYLKWHPQSCYYYAVEHGGFQASPERTPGTYSKYNSIDDRIDDLHYYTTYIKFGIGRATYDASQEIRSGDITRDEGVALVRRFDGEWPKRFERQIFDYLSIGSREFFDASKMFKNPLMSREYFYDLADKFRSPHLWKKEGEQWRLRHPIWEIQGGGQVVRLSNC